MKPPLGLLNLGEQREVSIIISPKDLATILHEGAASSSPSSLDQTDRFQVREGTFLFFYVILYSFTIIGSFIVGIIGGIGGNR